MSNMAEVFCFLLYISSLEARNYVYDSTVRTWNDAKVWCEQTHEGLATILTSADRQTAINKAGGNCWIGLNDLDQNGAWTWIDGTPCTVTTGHHCSDFWGQVEPSSDGYCLEFVDGQGTFNDKDCNTNNGIGTLCNTPTSSPTKRPSSSPTYIPTMIPTVNPTINPTIIPTINPTNNPITTQPTTMTPTISPHSPSERLGIISPTISQEEKENKVVETTQNEIKQNETAQKPTDQSFDYLLLLYIVIACLICTCIILLIIWIKKRGKYSQTSDSMVDIIRYKLHSTPKRETTTGDNNTMNGTELQSASSNKSDDNNDNSGFVLDSEPTEHKQGFDSNEQMYATRQCNDDELYVKPTANETTKGDVIHTVSTKDKHKSNESNNDDLYITTQAVTTAN